MARERENRNGASEAYEYQNALSSCMVTLLEAFGLLAVGVVLMLAVLA